MSKIRNPHLIPTGTLLAGTSASSVNAEKAIVIEKGSAVNTLNFIFGQSTTEKPVIWSMADEATRDTEFNGLVVSSTDWAVATRLPFVKSSGATIETIYGINLDLIDQISVDQVQDVLGGPVIYRIVFTYEAIGYGPKQLFWTYTTSGARDTVYGEVTNVVASMTFL